MPEVETEVIRVAVGNTRSKLKKHTDMGWRVVSSTTFNEKYGVTQVVLERDKTAREHAERRAGEQREQLIAKNKELWEGKTVFVLIWVLAILSVGYFLPTAVATTRRRWNVPVIFFVNAVLGWTVIGWVLALVMALSNKPEPESPQTTASPEVLSGAAPIPPDRPRGLTDDLRELADLHASGALSEEEFAAAKARLLG